MSRTHSLLPQTLLLLVLLWPVAAAQAAQVRLSWDAPTRNANGTPVTDLAGYKVYYGPASGQYTATVDVGNQTTHTLTGLADGQTYYFTVTAYDTARNESGYATPVSISTPPSPATDTDGDGLTDSEERALGTDPTQADSDGDGVPDGEEVRTYRTNPLLVDTDGDRVSDRLEIAARTDPTSAASRPSAWHLEYGEVVRTHLWRRVTFRKPFVDPIVVATSLSMRSTSPDLVRIRRVGPTGFDIRVQEWEYQDDIHPEETIGYLVLERGSYVLDDGTLVQADRFQASLTPAFAPVTFPSPFTLQPVVLTAVTSVAEADAVISRVRHISPQGFEWQLQEEERRGQVHATETVSYIAWEPSLGTIDGMAFEVATTPDSVTDRLYSIKFATTFARSPVFLAAMQTTDEADPATVRWQSKNLTGVSIKIAEEISLDSELTHTTEVVGYMAFGPAGN